MTSKREEVIELLNEVGGKWEINQHIADALLERFCIEAHEYLRHTQFIEAGSNYDDYPHGRQLGSTRVIESYKCKHCGRVREEGK